MQKISYLRLDMGSRLSDGNLLRRVIYPACDAVQIPRLSWHLFRHLHGTLLAHFGVHVAIAQAQLGHADPRITLAIYTHVMPDANGKRWNGWKLF
jgi:integrase